MRPFLFPLFLKICMLISQSNSIWDIESVGPIFSICQILIHAIMSVILFLFYQKLCLKPVISFLLALIIGLNPSIIFFTTYVISDYLMNVFITLSWLTFFILMENIGINRERKSNILAVIFGILNGIATLTKLVWLYAIFPFVAFLIYKFGINKVSVRVSLIIIVINFSFYY